MGLFKKIKKAFKKIVSGVSKTIKKIRFMIVPPNYRMSFDWRENGLIPVKKRIPGAFY